MMAMTGAAIAKAYPIVRRACLTSPAIKEIASGPVQAKAMVDQNMRSVTLRPGRTVAAFTGVAMPNLCQASTPSPIKSSVTDQRLTAPTLFNHFSISRPSTFKKVAKASPISEIVMKYPGEPDSRLALPPWTNSKLPAMKYNSAGKYGRVDVQEVQ